jgi:sugar/nucleoside kinase (ribokinase family)
MNAVMDAQEARTTMSTKVLNSPAVLAGDESRHSGPFATSVGGAATYFARASSRLGALTVQ